MMEKEGNNPRSSRERDRPFDLRDNGRALPIRLWIYQGERFPFAQYLPLVAAFTFSASGYSALSGGRAGLFRWPVMAVGILTAFCLFFLLRLFDEFKDAKDDARFRPYRAVPRGLVSFGELRGLLLALVGLALAANAALEPRLLAPLSLSLCYILLMWREFFISGWLRRRPVPYMLTHMLVMPLVDFYTSGLDWLVAGVPMPRGMILFLALTFTNGCVIEIGRKIRVPADEEDGVETYSSLWGRFRAAAIWLAVLTLTFALSLACCLMRGYLLHAWPWLALAWAGAAAPAVLFLCGKDTGHGIETASGAWTVLMYVLTGAVPYLLRWGAP